MFSGNCNMVIDSKTISVAEVVNGKLEERSERQYYQCNKRIDIKDTTRLRNIYGFSHLENNKCVKHLMEQITIMNGVPEQEMIDLLKKIE